MALPVKLQPAQLSQQLALALAPILEDYLKEPKQAISDISHRVETLEQKAARESLTRSQGRSVQKAVAQKVREMTKAIEGTSLQQHFANVYGSLKDKYNVPSYLDIPREKFLDAMQLVATYDGSGRNWWMD